MVITVDIFYYKYEVEKKGSIKNKSVGERRVSNIFERKYIKIDVRQRDEQANFVQSRLDKIKMSVGTVKAGYV